MATPDYVPGTTTVATKTTGVALTGLVLSASGSAATGDYAVVFFTMDPAAGAVSFAFVGGTATFGAFTVPPNGDTTNGSGTAGIRLVFAYARCTAGGTLGSVTVTHPSCAARSARGGIVTGADASVPLQDSQSSTAGAPTLTPTGAGADCLVLALGAVENASGTAATRTDPAGWTLDITETATGGTTGGGGATNVSLARASWLRSAAPADPVVAAINASAGNRVWFAALFQNAPPPVTVSGSLSLGGASSARAAPAASGSLTLGGSATGEAGFLPSDIADLSLWVEGDAITQADATPVATWPDWAPVPHDPTQATPGARPTLRTGIVNGHAAVLFDGTQWLDSALGIGTTPVTVFAVIRPTSFAVERTIIGQQSSNGALIWKTTLTGKHAIGQFGVVDFGASSTSLVADAPSVIAASYSTTGDYLYSTAGANDGSGTDLRSLSANGTRIGAVSNFGGGGAPEYGFVGYIAALIRYDRVLTPYERSRVHGYLAKYGLTVTPPNAAGGSLTLGGTVTARAPAAASGTLTLGGSATGRATGGASGSLSLAGTGTGSGAVPAVSGGLALGGSATGRGGAVAAGSVTLAGTAAGAAGAAGIAGSLTLGGQAATTVAGISGTMALGGAATSRAAAVAAGTLALGGSAAWSAPTVSGSLSLAGAAAGAGVAAPSGVLSLDGSAAPSAAVAAAGSLSLSGAGAWTASLAGGSIELGGSIAAATTAGTSGGSLTLGGTAQWSVPAVAGSLTLAGSAATSGAVAAAGSLALDASAGQVAPDVGAAGSVELAGGAGADASQAAAGGLTIAGTAGTQAGGTAAGSLTLGGAAAWTVDGIGGIGGALTLGGAADPAGDTPATAGTLWLDGSAAPATAPATSGSLTLDAATTSSGAAVAVPSLELAGTAGTSAPAGASGSVTLSAAVTGGAAAPTEGSLHLAGDAASVAGGAGAAGGVTLGGSAAYEGAAPPAAGALTLQGQAAAVVPLGAAGAIDLSATAAASTVAAAVAAGWIVLGGSVGQPATGDPLVLTVGAAGGGWAAGAATLGWQVGRDAPAWVVG